MRYLSETRFSFQSKALAEDTFGVVSFTGSEGLSQLYRFDISLISDNPNLDMQAVLQDRAVFRLHRFDGSIVPFHGIVVEFDLLRAVGDCFLYRVLLVPALWRLTLSHHQQVFLDKTPEAILKTVLEDAYFTTLDYEFRLQATYFEWEYACQYGESHYDFFSRWLERNGMYYFFDQSGDWEKLIITDSKMSHTTAPLGTKVVYSPVSGMEALHLDEVAQTFICRRRNVPQSVNLRDYDYRNPSLDVSGHAEISADGFGEMYYYGDHFRTPEGGNKLAALRAEEMLCRAEQYHGESTVPYISPGFRFLLERHFREDMNGAYLTLSMEHEGNQAAFLLTGLGEILSLGETQSRYSNSFTAIPDGVQFRAERTTPRPRIHGTINARVDGTTSGQYAELDEQGRYKVILPFDRADHSIAGKASAWVRMMQPSAGPGMGMHFPLHKGTEVLLTFIDGNPDRPIIAGAIPNGEHRSVVNSDNHTRAGFRTAGGSSFHAEDDEGHEHVIMKAGDGSTGMRLGAGSPSSAIITSQAMVALGCGGASEFMGAVFGGMDAFLSLGLEVGSKQSFAINLLSQMAVMGGEIWVELQDDSEEKDEEYDPADNNSRIYAMAVDGLVTLIELIQFCIAIKDYRKDKDIGIRIESEKGAKNGISMRKNGKNILITSEAGCVTVEAKEKAFLYIGRNRSTTTGVGPTTVDGFAGLEGTTVKLAAVTTTTTTTTTTENSTCTLTKDHGIQLQVNTEGKSITLTAKSANNRASTCKLTDGGNIEFAVEADDTKIMLTAGSTTCKLTKDGDIELTIATDNKKIMLTAGGATCSLTRTGATEGTVEIVGKTKATLQSSVGKVEVAGKNVTIDTTGGELKMLGKTATISSETIKLA